MAVQGHGGGLLANAGSDRVGTQLKGPVTILLVLFHHSEGARWAGKEHRGGGALVFESPVWSSFLTPQGLNCNCNQSALFPEVKKTRPDRKKTADNSFNWFKTGFLANILQL